MTTDTTDETFQSDILASEKTVLVDFWAPWCGPCRLVSPVLDQINEENDEIELLKLNIDENPETAKAFQIMSIPTILAFKGGKLVKTSVGAKSKAAFLIEFAEFLEG